mmetsp:Transcript_40047/g.111287  ORF Transcript_40047/g.111287 Transcript_40047/m.111287 type:complete len:446 (+) Transcript_40047:111-1448(+)
MPMASVMLEGASISCTSLRPSPARQAAHSAASCPKPVSLCHRLAACHRLAIIWHKQPPARGPAPAPRAQHRRQQRRAGTRGGRAQCEARGLLHRRGRGRSRGRARGRCGELHDAGQRGVPPRRRKGQDATGAEGAADADPLDEARRAGHRPVVHPGGAAVPAPLLEEQAAVPELPLLRRVAGQLPAVAVLRRHRAADARVVLLDVRVGALVAAADVGCAVLEVVEARHREVQVHSVTAVAPGRAAVLLHDHGSPVRMCGVRILHERTLPAPTDATVIRIATTATVVLAHEGRQCIGGRAREPHGLSVQRPAEVSWVLRPVTWRRDVLALIPRLERAGVAALATAIPVVSHLHVAALPRGCRRWCGHWSQCGCQRCRTGRWPWHGCGGWAWSGRRGWRLGGHRLGDSRGRRCGCRRRGGSQRWHCRRRFAGRCRTCLPGAPHCSTT